MALSSHQNVTTPKFWRDAALPFIETREIQDGRGVCYARHTHETFSIGAITSGETICLHGAQQHRIGAGSLVLFNPGDVHACNPLDDQPWSYRMMYVDCQWLAQCQARAGWGNGTAFLPFSTIVSQQPTLLDGYHDLYTVLIDTQVPSAYKAQVAQGFFIDLARQLDPAMESHKAAHPAIEQLAVTLREHCTQPLKLDDLCHASGLSMAHMIRLFKAHYGMTPHEYLLNSRIEYSRAQLRQGKPIADVAGDAGFADQAHLQRVFKKLTAATPGQYRG